MYLNHHFNLNKSFWIFSSLNIFMKENWIIALLLWWVLILNPTSETHGKSNQIADFRNYFNFKKQISDRGVTDLKFQTKFNFTRFLVYCDVEMWLMRLNVVWLKNKNDCFLSTQKVWFLEIVTTMQLQCNRIRHPREFGLRIFFLIFQQKRWSRAVEKNSASVQEIVKFI